MFCHCVNNYHVMTVVLEEASLMMGTNPVPET
jgi:hypothetical protein